jgi:hypothetical protein
VYHRDSRVERQRFGEQELEQRILQNWKPLRIVADLSVETHADIVWRKAGGLLS